MEKVTNIVNIRKYNLASNINKNTKSKSQISTNNNVDLKGFNAYKQYFIPFKSSSTDNPVIDLNSIESYNLDNNIRLVFDTHRTNTETNIRCLLTPTKETEAKSGTYDLLNYMLAEESDKFSDKVRNNSDNELPLYLACNISNKKIEGYMHGDHTRTLEGIERLKQFIFSPTFTEENLAKAKNKFKNHFKYASEDIGYKAEQELLNGSYEEKMKNIDSIDLDNVKNLYNQILANSEGKIFISLPKPVYKQQKANIFNILSTEIPTLKPYTGKNYTEDLKPIEKDVVYKQTKKAHADTDIGRTNYERIFVLPNLKSTKEEAVNDMLTKAIWNVLQYALSDESELHGGCDHLKGLLSITADYKTYNGVFDKIQNKSDNTSEYENMLNKVIKRIISEPISENELFLAKYELEEDLASTGNEQHLRTWELVNNRPGDNNYINEYSKELEKVTPADIQAAAQKYLTQPSITAIDEKI